MLIFDTSARQMYVFLLQDLGGVNSLFLAVRVASSFPSLSFEHAAKTYDGRCVRKTFLVSQQTSNNMAWGKKTRFNPSNPLRCAELSCVESSRARKTHDNHSRSWVHKGLFSFYAVLINITFGLSQFHAVLRGSADKSSAKSCKNLPFLLLLNPSIDVGSKVAHRGQTKKGP